MLLVGTGWNRLKTILKEPRVYSSVAFTFLLFPLGVLYFSVIVSLLAASLGLIVAPIGLFVPDYYMIDTIINGGTTTEAMVRVLLCITGIVLLVWTFHLSNIMWYLHGKLCRSMLLKR
jgi:hypothetical protein